jgi:hypothetical protein
MTLSDGLVQRKKTNNTTEYDDFSVNSHNPEVRFLCFFQLLGFKL